MEKGGSGSLFFSKRGVWFSVLACCSFSKETTTTIVSLFPDLLHSLPVPTSLGFTTIKPTFVAEPSSKPISAYGRIARSVSRAEVSSPFPLSSDDNEAPFLAIPCPRDDTRTGSCAVPRIRALSLRSKKEGEEGIRSYGPDHRTAPSSEPTSLPPGDPVQPPRRQDDGSNSGLFPTDRQRETATLLPPPVAAPSPRVLLRHHAIAAVCLLPDPATRSHAVIGFPSFLHLLPLDPPWPSPSSSLSNREPEATGRSSRTQPP